MALLSMNHQSNLQTKLEELERRNQLLEAEIERLQVYKDYAYTDALTEIPNRRFYYERLLQEVARSRRIGRDDAPHARERPAPPGPCRGLGRVRRLSAPRRA